MPGPNPPPPRAAGNCAPLLDPIVRWNALSCARSPWLFALCALVAPGCRRAPGEEVVLRLATTQPGERMREPFQAALTAFERQHPGVRVELVEMDDEVYQKMGLITLFVGGTPPDVYFQWGGYQVRKYAAAGYALDLSTEFPEP